MAIPYVMERSQSSVRAKAMSRMLIRTGPSAYVFASGNFWRESSSKN